MNVWSSLVLLRSDTLRKNSDFLPGEGPVSAEEFLSKAQGHSSSAVLLDYIEDLAKAYETEGNQNQALAFRQILGRVGRSGIDQAKNAIQTGHYQTAIPMLLDSVQKGQWGDQLAAEQLGDAYAKINEPDQARQWYRQSYNLYKKRGLSGVNALMGELTLEFNLKNFPRVVEICQQMQAEAPADPRGYIFEGRALEEMGKVDQAFRCYEKAERLPEIAYKDAVVTPADLQRQMGVAAQKLGKKEEMKKHFKRCLELNPQDPQRTAIEQILQKS